MHDRVQQPNHYGRQMCAFQIRGTLRWISRLLKTRSTSQSHREHWSFQPFGHKPETPFDWMNLGPGVEVAVTHLFNGRQLLDCDDRGGCGAFHRRRTGGKETKSRHQWTSSSKGKACDDAESPWFRSIRLFVSLNLVCRVKQQRIDHNNINCVFL